MLIKMLSQPDRVHLLNVASLLAISDKPLLWDGKTYEELTAQTSRSEISIKVSDAERELIEELAESSGLGDYGGYGSTAGDDILDQVSDSLIDELENTPFIKMEDPDTRAKAASRVLLKLLAEKEYDLPSVPKVILYELFLVALRDGHISEIEWMLLRDVQQYYKLEDFIFDDLLERAETLNQELSKTIAIILE